MNPLISRLICSIAATLIALNRVSSPVPRSLNRKPFVTVEEKRDESELMGCEGEVMGRGEYYKSSELEWGTAMERRGDVVKRGATGRVGGD